VTADISEGFFKNHRINGRVALSLLRPRRGSSKFLAVMDIYGTEQ
jgi:hypothetical protein